MKIYTVAFLLLIKYFIYAVLELEKNAVTAEFKRYVFVKQITSSSL